LNTSLKTTLIFTLLLYFIFFPLKILSQNQDIRFDHITPGDGLIHDIVTAIVQDEDGFIWIGTEDGLMKYDSYTLTPFKNDPDDSSTIKDDWISRMLCDSKGRLWIGTALGLDRYDKKSASFIHYYLPLKASQTGIPNNGVVLLYEDKKGNLFTYTQASGLWVYDEKKDIFQKNPLVNKIESELPGLLTTLFQDSEGTYWIGTYNGLLKWKNEKNFRLLKKNNLELSDSKIFNINEDANGNIWIATEFGLNKIDKTSGKIKIYFPTPKNNLCD